MPRGGGRVRIKHLTVPRLRSNGIETRSLCIDTYWGMSMDTDNDGWNKAILKDEYQDILATEDCFELPFKENKMRYFSFNEYSESGGHIETWSEDDIRNKFWPYWYGKMCDKYEQSYVDKNYTFEDCIEDWIVVHYARPSDIGEIFHKEASDGK